MPTQKKTTPIETIKAHFSKINDKTSLIHDLVAELKPTGNKNKPTKFGTIRNTWFSNYQGWRIPEEHQETVLRIICKTLNQQNNDDN